MNLGGQKSAQVSAFISFGDVARSGTGPSYGNSVFNLLRNYHAGFHSSCMPETNMYVLYFTLPNNILSVVLIS